VSMTEGAQASRLPQPDLAVLPLRLNFSLCQDSIPYFLSGGTF
jgi:hypothetical protein